MLLSSLTFRMTLFVVYSPMARVTMAVVGGLWNVCIEQNTIALALRVRSTSTDHRAALSFLSSDCKPVISTSNKDAVVNTAPLCIHWSHCLADWTTTEQLITQRYWVPKEILSATGYTKRKWYWSLDFLQKCLLLTHICGHQKQASSDHSKPAAVLPIGCSHG